VRRLSAEQGHHAPAGGGYVVARKGSLGSRPRTWVYSTSTGRAAFAGHLQALREIVALGGGPAL